MTDNEIIKSLECCLNTYCSSCPCEKGASIECLDDLHRYALDLINRQKAKIERLQDEIVTWKRISDDKTKALFEHCDVIDELHEKITRLEETKNRLLYNLQAALDERADHSEAVKECIEKIKSKASKSVMIDNGIPVAGSASYWISEVTLCEIEKEMVGADGD